MQPLRAIVICCQSVDLLPPRNGKASSHSIKVLPLQDFRGSAASDAKTALIKKETVENRSHEAVGTLATSCQQTYRRAASGNWLFYDGLGELASIKVARLCQVHSSAPCRGQGSHQA